MAELGRHVDPIDIFVEHVDKIEKRRHIGRRSEWISVLRRKRNCAGTFRQQHP